MAEDNPCTAIVKEHYGEVYEAYGVLKDIDNIKAIKEAKVILDRVKAILIFNKSNRTNRYDLIFLGLLAN